MPEKKPVEKPELPSIDDATAKLAPFFELNPYSTVEKPDADDGLKIVKPWNDPSLILDVDEHFDDLAQALNAVKLPERLSALWHSDTKRLEVIWTAFKLPKSQAEMKDRSFVFRHRGKTFACEFSDSSDRLMAIARSARPRTISQTNHRNIQSFSYIAQFPDEKDGSFDRARSFWINDLDWDEADVIDVITHLNFHMTYFDGLAPTVLVHAAVNEPMVPKKTRYIRGTFPDEIDCTPLDENMLSFWSFADTGNPMLRFLLYYRILEYAAYHFVTDEVRDQMKRTLLAPDLRSDIGKAIAEMMGAMGSMKLSDSQRLSTLARKVVDPALLWRDLNANVDFFTKDTKFDGGFTVKAPIGKSDKQENFGVAGVERVVDRFRAIRNALSHGKDQESSGVIRPTPENVNLFRPWVHLIATAAGEVVLYGTKH
ncbi:hypothetical protein MNQ96_05035 [Sphingopyxis granuli]|uniref:hypothetical protein n=1 Tax=Sphingopyxis granuli TaxID=267128 RepID=UPI001F5364FA|nr:hypothetical protein [Sphingopyxis granuli]UNK80446.1 hypothetical protein MNQ96_05035 [Sphingopyxis granuli]